MSSRSKTVIVIVAAALAGFLMAKIPLPGLASDTSKIAELEAELQKVRDQEAADERLGQFAINSMYMAKAEKYLSKAKMLILAQAIVRVSNSVFANESDRRAFVSIIAIESQFRRFAQSPTGPRGLTQVARKAFMEAMKECGIEDVHDEDVWEMDINLYAGACYYQKMLFIAGGDHDTANVAYNQGPNSDSFKMYTKYGELKDHEPMKYIIKFSYLDKNTTDQVKPGVPAVKDLPKPKPVSKVEASSAPSTTAEPLPVPSPTVLK